MPLSEPRRTYCKFVFQKQTSFKIHWLASSSSLVGHFVEGSICWSGSASKTTHPTKSLTFNYAILQQNSILSRYQHLSNIKKNCTGIFIKRELTLTSNTSPYICTQTIMFTCFVAARSGIIVFSQWETTLHCNVVSHWLSPWSLKVNEVIRLE